MDSPSNPHSIDPNVTAVEDTVGTNVVAANADVNVTAASSAATALDADAADRRAIKRKQSIQANNNEDDVESVQL